MKIAIFDIDDTLLYDSKVDGSNVTFNVNDQVRRWVYYCSDRGYELVILTLRPDTEVSRVVLEKQLEAVGVWDRINFVYMCPEDYDPIVFKKDVRWQLLSTDDLSIIMNFGDQDTDFYWYDMPDIQPVLVSKSRRFSITSFSVDDINIVEIKCQ